MYVNHESVMKCYILLPRPSFFLENLNSLVLHSLSKHFRFNIFPLFHFVELECNTFFFFSPRWGVLSFYSDLLAVDFIMHNCNVFVAYFLSHFL